METSTSEKSFLGTSIEDLYYGHGPWDFDVPSISASRHHSVLYQLPLTLKSPPKPFSTSQVHHWDDFHVRMPYSSKNLFPVKKENGEEVLKERWEIIQESLLQPITCSKELEVVINSYNSKLPKFGALHHFFENVIDEEEAKQFFDSLLPRIIRLALRLPEIVPGSLPLLKKGSSKSLSLSQQQIACLLANAFLCTFPWRKEMSANYPGANFIRLFSAHFRPKREQAVAEKLKCICHYFNRVLFSEPVGVVTFKRKHFAKSLLPRWDRSDNNLGNTRVHISCTGVIEDSLGLLQVDFANRNVGGGVLSYGCVQEEIRFLICPELIISRLFTEQLDSTEALIITGIERFSSYSGYGDGFEWAGNFQDGTPCDSSGRKRTSVVAIDALHFVKTNEQYNPACILRELNKAYVGFQSRSESRLPAVATGNWGCGAFHGDPKLKFLIQLMACSAAKRDMVYYTFGDTELRDSMYEMYMFLATNQVTVSQLWRYLCRFAQASLKSEHLYSYIHQAHVDCKTQPSIKEFFSFNKKKPLNISIASTSTAGHTSESTSDTVDGEFEITDIKKSDIANSQNKDVLIDIDCDIIESSQPEQQYEQSTHKKSDSNSNKCNSRDSQNKRQNTETEVLNLISMIDGDLIKSNNNSSATGTSLLGAIDEHSKRLKDVKRKLQEEAVERMDVDSGDCESLSIDNLYKETEFKHSDTKELPNKRKITDYFVKVDKG